jgi:hypothetical protein
MNIAAVPDEHQGCGQLDPVTSSKITSTPRNWKLGLCKSDDPWRGFETRMRFCRKVALGCQSSFSAKEDSERVGFALELTSQAGRYGPDSKGSSAGTEGLSIFCWHCCSVGPPQFATSFIYQTLRIGYAAGFCLMRCVGERRFSLICSVRTTLLPRRASCPSSCWIACSR